MILMNRNAVDGNTALNPKPYEKKVDRKQIKKDKNRKRLKLREASIKNKLKIMMSIGIAFVVAMVLILRFAFICNLRKDIANTQKQIVAVKSKNENLKVELFKYDNLQFIEKQSKELGMDRANLSNVKYCNLDNQNFKENIKKNSSKNKKKSTIINIIKSKLF